MKKTDWKKLQDFQNENKDLLIMVASPADDAIAVSFGGLNGFVKFPKPESIDQGVVFNALRESKFKEAIDPFMAGFLKGSGMKMKGSAMQVAHVLGGSMKSIGITKKASIKKQ